MLRCFGASRAVIVGTLLLEAFWLTTLAAMVGFVLAYLGLMMVAQWLLNARGVMLPVSLELWLLPLLLGALWFVGLLASALPAWRAYRMDVAKVLSDG